MSTEIEKRLWKKADRYVKILQIVPFVKMVAVCNNLAFGQVDEDSDIDLFIVAERGRLFAVRSLVTLILQILGVRRHGDKIAGRFCLSFFIDEDSMDLSGIAIEDDIYLAYWIRSMVPLIDEGGKTANEFLMKNNWVSKYFVDENDFYIRVDKVLASSAWSKFWNKILGFVFGGSSGDFLEKKLKKWQMKRALKKMQEAREPGGLIVEDHILKFHNTDRRREYRDKWFQKYGQAIKITDEKFTNLY